MKKKNMTAWRNKPFVITVVVALIAVALSGAVGYHLAYQKYNPTKVPTENKPGYITAGEARNQVNNFYRQYLHPARDPQELRKVFISHYGDKNLVFYSEYYQHGFDPIVCSTVMPTSVTVTSVQPGPGAVVWAKATYPDSSTANLTLTLVINTEGFRIDSIICPGAKGNLPPQS